MLLLVLLAAGLHEEGVRRHLAPRLVGVALPHAAAAAEAACPPGGRAVERWRAGLLPAQTPPPYPTPPRGSAARPRPAQPFLTGKPRASTPRAAFPAAASRAAFKRLRSRARPSFPPPQPGPSGPHPETTGGALPQQPRRPSKPLRKEASRPRTHGPERALAWRKIFLRVLRSGRVSPRLCCPGSGVNWLVANAILRLLFCRLLRATAT